MVDFINISFVGALVNAFAVLMLVVPIVGA
jgi:hypothetical protein